MLRRNFFSVRLVRHWNKFSRVLVDVPFLEMFKAKLDGALSNLIWSKLSLPVDRDLGGL